MKRSKKDMEMIQNNVLDQRRKEMAKMIIQKFMNIIASRQQLFKKTILQNRRKSIQRIRFRQMLLRQQYFQIMTDIQRQFVMEMAVPRSPRMNGVDADPDEEVSCPFSTEKNLKNT